MKTTLLSAVAAIALSLGAAGAAQAEAGISGIKLDTAPQIAQAGCFYQYAYVWNGYGYAYVYRYVCY